MTDAVYVPMMLLAVGNRRFLYHGRNCNVRGKKRRDWELRPHQPTKRNLASRDDVRARSLIHLYLELAVLARTPDTWVGVMAFLMLWLGREMDFMAEVSHERASVRRFVRRHLGRIVVGVILMGMTSLTMRKLDETSTTAAGQNMLRRVLPNCQIEPIP